MFSHNDIIISLDTETTGLNPWTGDRVFAVSLCDTEGNTHYIQWPVDLITRNVTPDPGDVEWLNEILSDVDKEVTGFNLPFDELMLSFSGVKIGRKRREVSYMAKICNSQEFVVRLKPLAKKYCGMPDDDEKSLGDLVKRLRRRAAKEGFICRPGESMWKADYWLVPHYHPEKTECEEYARKDAMRTMRLDMMYWDVMLSTPDYMGTYLREMALMPAFASMVAYGVHVDVVTARQLYDYHKDAAYNYQQEVFRILGREINVGSSPQLIKALYDNPPFGCGLVPTKFTDSGLPSTDWKALRPHRGHPIVKTIEEYKSAEKACSTFFGKYLELAIAERDYFVLHPGLNQIGATLTGRVSCSNPALQTIQKGNSPRGLEVVYARRPFGPRPGYVWYKVDYSAQEVRIFAEVSRCQKMLDAFKQGLKIHNVNANLAWGGKGNKAGLEACAYALELGNAHPSSELITNAWKEIGWDLWDHGQIIGAEAFNYAELWLSRFDYDIIKAEEALGKNQSKTKAKNVFFAKLYGGGPDAVSDMLFCTDKEAAAFLYQFTIQFPEIEQYIAHITDVARSQGYIVNLYGRRLNVNSWEAYKATNYMVQSTAADIMKESIRKCHAYLQRTGLDVHMVMTVHDELIFEFNLKHDKPWLLRGIKTLMEQTNLKVAMPVEISRVEKSWDDAKEIMV